MQPTSLEKSVWVHSVRPRNVRLLHETDSFLMPHLVCRITLSGRSLGRQPVELCFVLFRFFALAEGLEEVLKCRFTEPLPSDLFHVRCLPRLGLELAYNDEN